MNFGLIKPCKNELETVTKFMLCHTKEVCGFGKNQIN